MYQYEQGVHDATNPRGPWYLYHSGVDYYGCTMSAQRGPCRGPAVGLKRAETPEYQGAAACATHLPADIRYLPGDRVETMAGRTGTVVDDGSGAVAFVPDDGGRIEHQHEDFVLLFPIFPPAPPAPPNLSERESALAELGEVMFELGWALEQLSGHSGSKLQEECVGCGLSVSAALDILTRPR